MKPKTVILAAIGMMALNVVFFLGLVAGVIWLAVWLLRTLNVIP